MMSREMKWQQLTLCKLKLKKYILFFILSVGMLLYQEGYHMDCQQILNTQHSIKAQILNFQCSHLTEPKNQLLQFSKLEGAVLSAMTSF
jgi:hypothetical protein